MKALSTVLLLVVLTGCAETVRCPDGHVFDDDGDCIPITDAGPRDPGDGGDGG